MRKHTIQAVLAVSLVAMFATGCAHHRSNQVATFAPTDAMELTPTSPRAESQVYADTPQGIIGRTTPPAGVSAEDWALSENIRAALSSDRRLNPYPSQVSITVDRNTKGRVILRGVAPTPSERKRIQERVAKVPGVLQVDNQIVVGDSVSPGIVDPREPIL